MKLPETNYVLAVPARPYENEYITNEDGYSADDMRDYGRANFELALQSDGDYIRAVISERDALRAEVERLKAVVTDYLLIAKDSVAEITSLRAEIERLTTERDINKRMRDQHFADLNLHKAMRESDDEENAALRAELAAINAREPVGKVTDKNDSGFLCTFNEKLPVGTVLYKD